METKRPGAWNSEARARKGLNYLMPHMSNGRGDEHTVRFDSSIFLTLTDTGSSELNWLHLDRQRAWMDHEGAGGLMLFSRRMQQARGKPIRQPIKIVPAQGTFDP